MDRHQDVFIWSEAFGCGELLNPLVSSFFAHHDLKLHLFGNVRDLDQLTVVDDRVSRVHPGHPAFPESVARQVKIGYQTGHLGTARLWAYLIRQRREKYLVHIDADMIFLGDAVSDVLNALMSGFVLAGSRRVYRNNSLGFANTYHTPDTVDTHCFGFSRERVSRFSAVTLTRRILGATRLDRLRRRVIIDFFDPVSLELLRKGAGAYLDSPFSGPHGLKDFDSPFLKKLLIVRSAVGSGCAISKGFMNASEPYRSYALESWEIYSSFFLKRAPRYVHGVDADLEFLISQVDTETWTRKSTP